VTELGGDEDWFWELELLFDCDNIELDPEDWVKVLWDEVEDTDCDPDEAADPE
jgi:hypothetical protein